MGCFDPDAQQLADVERYLEANQERSILQDHLHKRTEMLCALCGIIEVHFHDTIIDSVPGLREWWESHKKWDEARKKKGQS